MSTWMHEWLHACVCGCAGGWILDGWMVDGWVRSRLWTDVQGLHLSSLRLLCTPLCTLLTLGSLTVSLPREPLGRSSGKG